jgi:thymidine kinase
MFLENTVNQQEQFGWIEVICGSMFSGKTEELIRRLKRAQFAKQKVEIFKPAVDTRYDNEMVVSHNKNEIRSTPVPVAENIRILAQGCDVVGIDEAQFFDEEIVAVCNDLANSGIRVIVAGLDMDFKGNPFGPMPALMATAEYVTKVHAVCTRTGNLANYSFRKSDDKRLVMLGETEEYEPLSRAAYFKAVRENMEVKDVEILNKQKEDNQ